MAKSFKRLSYFRICSAECIYCDSADCFKDAMSPVSIIWLKLIPLATWKIDLIQGTIVHHGNWALRPKIQALKLYRKDFTFDIKDKLRRNFRFCNESR